MYKFSPDCVAISRDVAKYGYDALPPSESKINVLTLQLDVYPSKIHLHKTANFKYQPYSAGISRTSGSFLYVFEFKIFSNKTYKITACKWTKYLNNNGLKSHLLFVNYRLAFLTFLDWTHGYW